jgi:hypothetical protein
MMLAVVFAVGILVGGLIGVTRRDGRIAWPLVYLGRYLAPETCYDEYQFPEVRAVCCLPKGHVGYHETSTGLFWRKQQ